jgi:formylglycine-generating enzyme required for sulfatase activity
MKFLLMAIIVFTTSRWATPGNAASSQPAEKLALDLGNHLSLNVVKIPAGKFLMGSPEREKWHDPFELVHEVTISKPFYMGVTDVTVDQFAAFVADSGYTTDAEKEGSSMGYMIKGGKLWGNRGEGWSWRTPGFDQKGDHPVVQASWNDAQAFCAWLSKRSGKSVVLPTEAQWEYACRAGTRTAYQWGDNPNDGKGWANCADDSLKRAIPNAQAYHTFFGWNDGFVFTSPVAIFKANAFGLYDMTGNVWQWCQDRDGNYADGPATDPTGPKTGDSHLLRGGSWSVGPGLCRSASRYAADPPWQSNDYGFRVVVSGD